MSVFGVILVRIFPAFSRIRTEYEEILGISLHSVQMRENVGKMRTRITPNMDTFCAVLRKFPGYVIYCDYAQINGVKSCFSKR